MTPRLVAGVVAGYFVLLMLVSWFSSRKTTSASFFNANRRSPWYLVAFGMIGASLSGITFISVPGEVGNTNFSYYQMVLGYIPGYLTIALVLLPLYYRLNLVSIYSYLETRFGFWSHKTGSFFFLLSRTIGASFRLFLVAGVLQLSIFSKLGVGFGPTVLITIALIWAYTYKAGIKTIVWTDTLQTAFMLLSVIITIWLIGRELNMDLGTMVQTVNNHPYSKLFEWDWQSGHHFIKQFLSGAFIAIVMTGLDQDMMQKNLTCRNIKDAQKNIIWMSLALLPVNLLFMALGVLLYVYAAQFGVAPPERTDMLYPLLALEHFPLIAGVVFLLGIIAAAFSSADSALTSLTTSFCVDFLKLDIHVDSKHNKRAKLYTHLGFSALVFVVVYVFGMLNDKSVVSELFRVAGYTYGPLLGLFAFGLISKRQVTDRFVPAIAILAPVLTYVISKNSQAWFAYTFGYELLMLNGLLVCLGLWAVSKKQ